LKWDIVFVSDGKMAETALLDTIEMLKHAGDATVVHDNTTFA